MIPERVLNVLKFVAEDLKNKGIRWVLVGSLSLALQGVDIEPKDIDILTTKDDALRLNKLWEQYKIKDVSFGETEHFRSYHGKFRINDVNIEVMGDLEEKIEGKWVSLNKRIESPVFVNVLGIQVPVSSLEEQLSSYEKSKRQKDILRVKKIHEALAKQKG